MKGGPILCETRRLSALASRTVSEGGEQSVAADIEAPAAAPPPVRARKPRVPAGAPAKPVADSEGFTSVTKKSAPKPKKASA